MAAAAHTPGPWVARVTNNVGRQWANVWTGNGDILVAECGSSSLSRAGNIANANLIAAAPELLSLLQDWVMSFADCIEGGEADPLVSATRAAIAKATGSVS